MAEIRVQFFLPHVTLRGNVYMCVYTLLLVLIIHHIIQATDPGYNYC